MRKRMIFLRRFACVITCATVMNSVSAQSWPPAGMAGSGTSNDPWQITTSAQLRDLADYICTDHPDILRGKNGNALRGKYFKLMNDIDLKSHENDNLGRGWNPIGNGLTQNDSSRFMGHFDGNGKVVRNLIIKHMYSGFNRGLFGYIEGGSVKNLKLENCSIQAPEVIGGLAGACVNSTISGCSVTGNIKADDYVGTHIGGLVGACINSTISNCYAEVNIGGTNLVNANDAIGGLVGLSNNNSTISNCHATGNVEGSNFSGGLIGQATATTITDCYATGNINAALLIQNGFPAGNQIGGLVGRTIRSQISNCHATGVVYGHSHAGGFVGYNDSTNITNCYSEGNVDKGGYSNIGGLIGTNNYSAISNCHAINSNGIGGRQYFIGGLIGRNSNNSPVTNCYAKSSISGKDLYVGGLVGENSSSNISDCYAEGSVMSTGDNVGGLVGNNSDAVITNCYFNDSVSGHGEVGGLIGRISNGSISQCYAAGNVSGTYGNVGGLVGYSYNSNMEACYATGNVKGSHYQIGGLVGYNYSNSIISNCYAIGNVSGSSQFVGGLVGANKSGSTIVYCYASGNVNGTNNYVGGLAGSNDNATIRNCIAANMVVATSGATYINRIAGSVMGVVGTYAKNYALNDMTVQDGSGNIPVYDNLNGFAGASQPLTALRSLSFYNTGSNWDGLQWSVTPPSNVWTVCDGKKLPFLRWQNLDCTISVINISGIPATITVKTPLTLTPTVEPSDADKQTIVWSIKNKGTTNASLAGTTLNTTDTGTLILTATIKDGKSAGTDYIQDFSIAVINGNGIAESVLSNIKIYPNPTNGQLTIENGQLTVGTVEIYDVYGRRIVNCQLSTVNTIDISHLANGIYFLKIGNKRTKFVKN